METFCKPLYFTTKPIVDTVSGGSFMMLTYTEATIILDSITKINRAWHTRDSEVLCNSNAVGMSPEQ